MIRPFTAICMALAAGSGLYLYQQKHKSQVLERQIEDTVKKTIAAQRRVLFLTAEWDLLNDPERLAKLAEQFLKLRTMNPVQFAAIDDLGNRLPAVRAIPAAPDHTTEEPGAGDPAVDPVAEAPLPIPPALVPPPPAPAPAIARLVAPPAAGASPAAPGPVASPGVTAPASPPQRAAPASPPPVVAARPAPSAPTAAPRPQTVASPSVPSQPQAPAIGMSALGMARGSVAAPPPVPISATRDFNPVGGN